MGIRIIYYKIVQNIASNSHIKSINSTKLETNFSSFTTINFQKKIHFSAFSGNFLKYSLYDHEIRINLNIRIVLPSLDLVSQPEQRVELTLKEQFHVVQNKLPLKFFDLLLQIVLVFIPLVVRVRVLHFIHDSLEIFDAFIDLQFCNF